MSWEVYIAVTSKGNLYTGISTNPPQRVYEHNFTKKGAKALRGQRPVKLVWRLPAGSKSEALKEERRIKNLSRIEKIHMIILKPLVSDEELDELLFGSRDDS